MRDRYWSCSKFADWVRGTPKPYAAGMREWDDWHKEAKAKHPFRYWIAETFLMKAQDALWWPVDIYWHVVAYLNNRFVIKTNSLNIPASYMKPGTWRDLGDRLLPAMFFELKDFVEVECAWHNFRFSKDRSAVPWYRRAGLIRNWRSPEAGIEYLSWSAAQEDAPGQSSDAKEILELYHWFVNDYLHREDVYDITGWVKHCEDRPIGTEPTEETRRILNHITELEDQREREDEEMMIRLIKVRRSLWT